MSLDVSIIIVHTFERQLVRQTLRSLRRSAPKVSYEVIVVDNNPAAGMGQTLATEFHDVVYVPLTKNVGFGSAMNRGMEKAQGRYILIFNPDIIVRSGSLEELVRFMDISSDVGVCGPQLLNPDGTLQHSCYRLPSLFLPAYRRTPLGKWSHGREAVEDYLMMHDAHDETMDVDSLIGAALFCRAEVLKEIGMFDEQFFMYYEDNDLCRRFWQAGHRVVYHPGSVMVHYHRRASADGGLFSQLLSKFAWIQIASFIKYYRKYFRQSNPRINANGVANANTFAK